ncbi:aldo/keto reductase [Rhodococcus sp. X156]|uniref:aldo/keto reductase n=1 Tax=Rhodococcus sp. X156 TaxID=2499145 RepID=UPI000FDC811B|nr:aldo/keto reductase [Rhodococcus sp. X156]
MEHRTIGSRTVSAIGLGGMPMSVQGRPDRERALATVHAALNAGVTLIDTADAYSLDASDFGHNEELVAEALRHWGGDREDVLVATKGGHVRTADGGWALDGRPEHLRAACEASLRRLGVDTIDLYQLHRPDPAVPVEESVGALAELLDEGKISMAGVSNFDVDQIRLAQRVLGGRLASVQNEYSPRFRSSRPELELCAELGVAFLPWSPLGGIGKAAELGQAHQAFAEVAAEHHVSPQQVALAWELAAADVVIPIPGASRPASAVASAAATELALTPEQRARLDAA